MKPPPFDYDAPDTVEEALHLLAEHGDDAKVLAGGQSLIPLMALRLARPARLVDVGRIAALQAIRADGGLAIGAGVSQRTAERSPEIARHCPPVTQALPLVAHVPIRTRGTIGGSLAHADPAAELPAVALLVEADVVARSRSRGERVIAARDFFRGFFETALEPDELLVDVRIPPWPDRTGSAFEELARRHGDFALVGAGAVVGLADDGTVRDARLAFTGVAPTPIRVGGAESLLVGNEPTADAIAAAVEAARAELEPGDDVHATGAYRRHVAGVLAGRVLHDAVTHANRGTP
ncbi:MAG TPA: xanthine dehydrogenase family protein subunit M [Acidimicrobiia bacterium]|nr:xanthine dehydrogenase family protein subunit M [Acidimicrobiia bacterium]